MRRFIKYGLAVIVVVVGAVFALFEYAYQRDQANFAAAKNKCEVGCIQDSGGIDQCRPLCARHPDHYP